MLLDFSQIDIIPMHTPISGGFNSRHTVLSV